MFTYEGINRVSGTMVSLYEVHFYNNAGALKTIWVDTELLGGGDYYDHPVNGVLWVALAEKAYLEANSFGCVTTAQPGVDSYAALAIGKPMWALQGHHRTTGDRLQHRPHDIASVWNAGDLIVLGTPDTETDSHIMVIHAHAVVGYNASGTMPSQLYNPCARSPTGTPLATRASLGGPIQRQRILSVRVLRRADHRDRVILTVVPDALPFTQSQRRHHWRPGLDHSSAMLS